MNTLQFSGLVYMNPKHAERGIQIYADTIGKQPDNVLSARNGSFLVPDEYDDRFIKALNTAGIEHTYINTAEQ